MSDKPTIDLNVAQAAAAILKEAGRTRPNPHNPSGVPVPKYTSAERELLFRGFLIAISEGQPSA